MRVFDATRYKQVVAPHRSSESPRWTILRTPRRRQYPLQPGIVSASSSGEVPVRGAVACKRCLWYAGGVWREIEACQRQRRRHQAHPPARPPSAQRTKFAEAAAR